jgi:ammonium transporter, Amt family
LTAQLTTSKVPVYVAALVGLLTSVCCFFTNKYKYLISIDEGLDIFAIHGVGGFVGDILTGFFAASWVPALDGVSGSTYAGGWWEHNWIQMGYQLAAATTCAAWAFVVSCILLFIINRIPGCKLRVDEEDEMKGLDFKYLNDVDWEEERMMMGLFAPGGVGHATPREGVLHGIGSPGSAGSSTKGTEQIPVDPTKR